MDLQDTLNKICTLLANINCKYGVIGGLAIQSYGINRQTNDVDILIEPNILDTVKTSILNLGYKLDFYNHEVLRFKAKFQVDLLIATEPWLIEAINSSTPNKNAVMVIPPTELIGIKFRAMHTDPDRYASDLHDVYTIINHFKMLDQTRIKHFAKIYNIIEFIN